MKLFAWVKQFIYLFSLTTVLLSLVQFSKTGHWHSAISFALLWGFISTMVFLTVKVVKIKKAGLPVLLK